MRPSRALPGGLRLWHVLAVWTAIAALGAGGGLWIATSFHGSGSGGGCVVESRFGGCVVDDPGQAVPAAGDDADEEDLAGDGSEFDNARR